MNGASELHSLQEVVAETECGDVLELHDTLTTANDDPSTIVARHQSWQLVLNGLSELELAIVHALADGLSFRQVGRACKVSLAKVQEFQRRLAVRVVEVMGLDALADAMTRPQWKINLLTINEQLACKVTGKQLSERSWPSCSNDGRLKWCQREAPCPRTAT